MNDEFLCIFLTDRSTYWRVANNGDRSCSGGHRGMIWSPVKGSKHGLLGLKARSDVGIGPIFYSCTSPFGTSCGYLRQFYSLPFATSLPINQEEVGFKVLLMETHM